MTTYRGEAMSTEHAVDPSTLDPETWVEIAHPAHDYHVVSRVKDAAYNWPRWHIVAVLHRADECPPAEQWRQVTPEEVRPGWLVERRHPDGSLHRGRIIHVAGGYLDTPWTTIWGPGYGGELWTNEPADPDAERRRLIEAATGRNAETLEANLAEYGLAIVALEP